MGFHGVTPGNFAPPECIAHLMVVLEAAMPRYFFDIKNGHRLIDPAGLDCRDDQEARDQAIFIAGQIAADAPETSGGRTVAILDSDRREIDKVPVKQRTLESAVQALRDAHAKGAGH
jgi:hypothetical protein